MNKRILVPAAALTLATLTGCTPHDGDTCNPKTDRSYYSTHTENGKTKTTSLECSPSGIDSDGRQEYRWRKP